MLVRIRDSWFDAFEVVAVATISDIGPDAQSVIHFVRVAVRDKDWALRVPCASSEEAARVAAEFASRLNEAREQCGVTLAAAP